MTGSPATSRSPWRVVLLGLVLLSAHYAEPGPLTRVQGDAGLEKAVTVPGWPPLTRGQIVTVLQRWNPRLGSSDSARVSEALVRCSRDWGVDRRTALAVLLVESGARPAARSPKGAIGLMQVMPHMYAELGLPGNVAHLETNVEAGCMLLADNIRRLGEPDGISTYYWGSWIQGDAYLRRVMSVRDSLLRESAPDVAAGLG